MQLAVQYKEYFAFNMDKEEFYFFCSRAAAAFEQDTGCGGNNQKNLGILGSWMDTVPSPPSECVKS